MGTYGLRSGAEGGRGKLQVYCLVCALTLGKVVSLKFLFVSEIIWVWGIAFFGERGDFDDSYGA